MTPVEMRHFAAAMARAADDCASPRIERALATYPVLGAS
jgi:hypothetical protein